MDQKTHCRKDDLKVIIKKEATTDDFEMITYKTLYSDTELTGVLDRKICSPETQSQTCTTSSNMERYSVKETL